jgi:protein-L-isoaspartate(D-aspartate) O-methyltransferase
MPRRIIPKVGIGNPLQQAKIIAIHGCASRSATSIGSRRRSMRRGIGGLVAEWLRRGLQILASRFDSGRGLHRRRTFAPPDTARRGGMPVPSPDFAALRRNMVDTQLRTYDVTSHRLLDAIESVPREAFVPQHLVGLAYTDQEIAVSAGEGTVRHLLQPMVLGRLLQALDVQDGERALDCGGGSGYGAALLAALGAKVSAVEESDAVAALMRQSLAKAGIAGIAVSAGDVAAGSISESPFDVILVHGAVESAPEALLGQLAEGGRLGIVVGHGRAGRAVVFNRSGGVIGRKTVFDAAARPLKATVSSPAFSF